MISDLLHCAGFIERVGSGFSRMEKALAENNNPPLEVAATNFFNIRFFKRLQDVDESQLTSRQVALFRAVCSRNGISKRELASLFNLGEDTTLRELKHLITLGLISKQGVGRAIMYICLDKGKR